jgi:hypothetical protein
MTKISLILLIGKPTTARNDSVPLTSRCPQREISLIIITNLQQSCLDHGGYTLNQLHFLLHVNSGSAETTLRRLLLLLLDEPGIALSSPWSPTNDICIAERLWPSAWTEKQTWRQKAF